MIDSKIATSHHYYVVYLRFEKQISLAELIKVLGKNEGVNEYQQNNHAYYSHIQVELPEMLGIDSVMQPNKGRFNNKQYYWYDLYLFPIKTSSTCDFFLCFPYNGMNDYIESAFNEYGISFTVLKPQMDAILSYMKKGGADAPIHKTGFNMEIIKYSASIQEEANAKKINIFGENPLNSKVFTLISQPGTGFTIEPLSFKLKCYTGMESGVLEISFDKQGNGRYWLRKSLIDHNMKILPVLFQLMQQISALRGSHFINSYDSFDIRENE